MPRRAAPKPTELLDSQHQNLGDTSAQLESHVRNLAQLRTNWKWAAFGQFFYTFSHLFQMPDVALSDIEDDLARDTNIFLPRVMTRLLFILSYDRKVSLENWQSVLRKQHNRRDPASNPIGPEPITETQQSRYRYQSVPADDEPHSASDEATKDPPEETAQDNDLPDRSEKATSEGPSDSRAHTQDRTSPFPELEEQETRDWLQLPMLMKLDSMHLLTEWQFQNPTRLRTLMKSDDEDATWRIEPVGYDAKSNAYWLIGADRLWMQRSPPKPPRSTAATSSLKRKRPDHVTKASTSKSKRSPPKRARLASEDRKLTITVPAGGRAAKAQAKLRLDQQAKELAELNRAAGITTPATRELGRTRNQAARTRPLGTRVSARLRGADDDEWQAIPEAWLEDGGSRKKAPAQQKAKTGLESDDESVSDLTELSEDLTEDVPAERSSPEAEAEEESVIVENGEQDRQMDNFVEWETICVTLYDWEHIAERFEKATHYTERALYKVLTKEIVPVITEELREIERKQRLEEAIVHRKRSSRIANKEQEKEEARQIAKQKTELAEKKSRAQRHEARLAKEESERERREAARELRRKAKEEESRSVAEDEGSDTIVNVVNNDSSPIHLNHLPGSSSRNGMAIASTSTSGTRTPIGDDWILNCEICHRSGVNLDDGLSMLCCGSCSQWQHTRCHDLADQQAGRPPRNWDVVDFVCVQCQRRSLAAKPPPRQYPTSYAAPNPYLTQAVSSTPYARHVAGSSAAAHSLTDPTALLGPNGASQRMQYPPASSSSLSYRPAPVAPPPTQFFPQQHAYTVPHQPYQETYDRTPATFQHMPNTSINGHHGQHPNLQGWNNGHNAPYVPTNGVLHQYGDVGPGSWVGGPPQTAGYGYHRGQ